MPHGTEVPLYSRALFSARPEEQRPRLASKHGPNAPAQNTPEAADTPADEEEEEEEEEEKGPSLESGGDSAALLE